MAVVFFHKGKLFSISDPNANDEHVVVKFKIVRGQKVVDGVRIIQGANENQVKRLIRKYPFNTFKSL